MEHQASWIAEILLAAVLTATITFGSHLSTKLDRIEEGLTRNGEGLARIEGRTETTPPAPQGG
ncbi:MAG: hypothetical protein OXU78_04495 [Deltaproteobacteria bacterium]|nr:hypothetical protein [Deltaproteobacteria bacterium]MDD9853197.1 hypothetical protein [Deltaproteobacteria bacterium]